MAAMQQRVQSEPYAWPFHGDLRPQNTAIVAIDMQNDFCAKGGYVDAMGYDLSMTRSPIVPLQAVFACLRNLGYHVMHTREGHEPSLASCPENKRWRSAQVGGGVGIGDRAAAGDRVLVRGEPGHDLIEELYPLEGEVVIDKPGKGTFIGTDIELILRNKGIQNLIFAGVTTDVCVSTTMREANDHGYECLLLSDCTASADYGNYMAILKTTQLLGGVIGCVAPAADLLRALGAEVPSYLEDNLELVDLGDGVKVRMPKLPKCSSLPTRLEDVQVKPMTAPAELEAGKLLVSADPYLWPYDGNLTPSNTALLVIDFQADFVSPRGFLAQAGYDVGHCTAPLAASVKLLEFMRSKGFHIIHTRTGHAADLSDCPRRKAWQTKALMKAAVGAVGPLGRFLIRGEGGWQITSEMTPLDGEAVVEKTSTGAFIGTSLQLTLHNLGVRNLVLVGAMADVSVHTTMRQANDHGFECLMLEDCIATITPDVRFAALKQVKLSGGIFGAVTNSQALMSGLCRLRKPAAADAEQSRLHEIGGA